MVSVTFLVKPTPAYKMVEIVMSKKAPENVHLDVQQHYSAMETVIYSASLKIVNTMEEIVMTS